MRKQREIKVQIIMTCTPEELSTRFTKAMLKILDERKARERSMEKMQQLASRRE